MGSRAGTIAVLCLALVHAAEAQRAPRLERVATIGCDECGDSRAFSEIVDVAIAGSGTVWVADGLAPRVRAFTLQGAPVRAFGAHGRGPGEISAISRLLVSGGTISAIDPLTNQVTRFDTLGASLGTRALGQFAIDATIGPGSGELVVLTSTFRPGSSTVETLAPGASALAPRLGPLTDFPTADRPSEARALAVAPDGRIAITEAGPEYRIAVFDREGRRRDIVRELPRTRYTAAELAALERRRARGNRLRAAEATRGGAGPGAAPPLPTEKPHLRWGSLRFDPSGRLWVLTGRGGDGETVVDVYDRESRLLGEVRIPAIVGRMAMSDGHLVTSGEDPDGIPIVTIWRIVP